MNSNQPLLAEFENLLTDLLHDCNVPLEELDINQITVDLYNQKVSALDNIKHVLLTDKYASFHETFINHPQMKDIWKAKQTYAEQGLEDDLFHQFRTELHLLWKQYNFPDDLDFTSTAQRLFNKDTEVVEFETIKDNLLPNNFIGFKNDFMNNEKFKRIRQAKQQETSNSSYAKFRSEIITLFDSEGVTTEDVDHESLATSVFDNPDNVADILDGHLKSTIAPKKIRSLINKIQSNEKLKKLWNSKPTLSPKENFSSTVKSILKKHKFTIGNIDAIVSELCSNYDRGLHLIEDECTPEDFDKIKSDLMKCKEIQSRMSNSTITKCPSSGEKTSKELLEIELDKIWKDNAFNNLENSIRDQFVAGLIENGIDPAMQIIMSKMVKKHQSPLKDAINNNEKIRNIIMKPKVEDEKFSSIKPLQKIMFGSNDNYSEDLFSKIVQLDSENFQDIVKQEINNSNGKSLIDVMMPFIINKLKKGIDLSGLCTSEIFWDDRLPVYGTDYKTILVCMIERYKNHQIYFVSLLKKLGIALPFAYQWIIDGALKFKIPLRAYSHCLSVDCPIIISLGSNSIGKSALLNKIFNTQFITNKVAKINGGIDVIFSTPEFSSGFTIFDVHDHAHQQQNLLKVFCSMLPIKNCWILLQSASFNETNTMFKMLQSFNFIDYQIICIMRDYRRLTNEQEEQLRQYGIRHFLSICKIEHDNPEINSNLVTLREKLFKLTGIGEKSAKLPNNATVREEDYNVYLEIESKASQQKYDDIYIAIQDKETRDSSIYIDQLLRNIDKDKDNLQSFLFKHIQANNTIQGQRRSKAALIGKDTEQKAIQLSKIDGKIIEYSRAKASTMPSDLVLEYNKLFIKKKFNLIIEMDRRVCAWQSPILSPLFKKRNEILNKLKSCQATIQELKTKDNQSAKLKESEREMNELEKRKKDNSNSIDQQTINKDIFMRELLSMYGDDDFLANQSAGNELLNKDLYISSFVEYISNGNEIEVIDGDNNEFNAKIVADIFRGLEVKLNESEEPYVVSVIGPQSTGKSTLLNMLFGSNFQMSAGRCTKGLYASMFKTDYPNAKTLMVLDTEGLMSIEKANEEYDKKLTIFSMACSQVMLINLNGEINAAMKKILTISLFAANQLKIFKTRPIIIFILRNMMDLNVDKQKEMVDNVKKELEEVSKLCQLELTQVLDFKEEKAFFLMLTAFNKDSVYNRDKELFQKSTTNAKFAELIQDLRKIIFDEATLISKNGKKFKSLSDWVKHATEIWATLNLFNSIIMIESIKEINERKELGEVITLIMKTFIEPNEEKTSFRSKLDEILLEQEVSVNTTHNIDFDVEQRFDEEERNFTDKVKSEFTQETEKRSFAEKLIIEYRDRLSYAIKSSKTQAVEKYKAIAQKRKIQGKIEASLMDLQIRSETKILEWQKVKGDISEEEVTKKKQELKTWFETEMNITKEKIKKDLESNKKTVEQWRIFVKNQIISANGMLPVEKIFYSITTLQYKASYMISSSNNIITLTNDKHQLMQNDDIIKKIPTLINNRRRKVGLNRQNSCNAPAIQSRAKHETLHIQKSEKKIVAKWKQFTSWIASTFTFSHEESKRYGIIDDNRSLNQSSQDKLNELYDVCIDSDALVLIYSMFFEMNDYLTNEIKKEIFERAEYEIICLKQHLLQIHAKMNEISQKFLDDDDLEFTVNFGTDLIEWLYDIILEKMTSDERSTYEKLEQKADERIADLLRDFEDRLEKTFGDMEYAEIMAKKMLENVNSGCLAKIEREYKQKLKESTILHSSDLVRKSDEVFYGTNGIYKNDDIIEYITGMLGYMKKVYTTFFDTKNTVAFKECDCSYRTVFNQQRKILIDNLTKLESIFKDFKTTEMQDAHDLDNFQKFFKTYSEGKATWEQLKELSEKNSLPLGWVQPNELDNPDILFKNIAFFPITNPRVFIGAIIKTIQTRHENEINNVTSKFILTDDMLREKDQIKSKNQEDALGCIVQCPFCGCKCEEGSGPHSVHQSKKHRLMAFNGSFEMVSSERKGYVFDLCNSELTIRHSKWKENVSSQLSVHDSKEIRERMTQYAVGQGDVTISLIWFDSNDLDLHVTCPCGTVLFFGNTRCSSCSGYLDRDMNVCYCGVTCPQNKCSSTKPMESVFFTPAKSGIYKVSVNYYSGPKGNGGTKSNFEVRVSTHCKQSVQVMNGYVESSGSRKRQEVGQYEHSQGINFLQHVEKNFPEWRNISIVDDKSWENVLKKAWYQVASRMSQFHGFYNNTPNEFQNLIT
ncbi:unnamed protein product [Rotaria socialis]|uniref:VLIG-type G domain-containing protein n=1 Tax=Rotaria socialis TaxID=392032 RepID=A0A818U1V6_9BILA|nr:unnamed protein product [Rotaria socialis]CAF4549912.1 unnamed protein product [Rotaria socialis]